MSNTIRQREKEFFFCKVDYPEKDIIISWIFFLLFVIVAIRCEIPYREKRDESD